ncbi:Disease resistance protein [Melia azedarach]|uniref:Disease resistance protein n=1 Tax=Melia azedarach TaxID=155640 RepID=A0ACC1YJT9_MELAZ|nr:Disease resistance protein [Melia azedarach]
MLANLTFSGFPAYPLKELSNEDFLCLLAQQSLGPRDFSKHQSLKEIGEKIAIKRKGLPLAAKTVAGLLRVNMIGPLGKKMCSMGSGKVQRCDEVKGEISNQIGS